MKNLILNRNIKFSTTVTVVLTGACILISVFAIIGTVNASGTNPIGAGCSKNSDCVSNNCLFGSCFAQPFSSCNASSDCAGTNTNVMGCFNKGSGSQCYGRHGYPCGNYREDPVCAPGFHCDISGTLGYNYCESDHAWCSISANPTSIEKGQSSTLTWSSAGAVSCNASGAWSGSKSLNGNQSVSPDADSTYKLTCYSAVGFGYDCSATIDVNTTTPAPSCSISANPSSIEKGQSSTLTWSSTNATSCTASNAWSGTKSTSGSQSVSPTADSTYALACSGAGGSVRCATAIDVTVPETPTVSCALEANPNYSQDAPLNDVDLTASVGGTATGTIVYQFDCTNNGSWEYTSSATSSNPYTRSNLCDYTSAGIYTAKVKVTRAGVSATCTDSIVVEEQEEDEPSCSISANPTSITQGNYSNLNWHSHNATSCYASNAWSGNKSLSGNQTVSPNYDSTYTLVCSNAHHSTTCSATVDVAIEDEPSCSISANPTSITNGNYSTLNWSSNNASYCYASNAWSGTKSTSGSQSVSPSSTSTYSLTCYNGYYGSITCSTTVNVNTIYTNPNLSIEKLVRNVTNSNPSFYENVSANLGDEIEFLIRVNSIGTGTIYNVRVRDILPANMTYVSGTTTVDGSYRGDGIINGWITIGDIAQGSSKEIKFKAKISSTIAGVSGGSATINVANQNIQTSTGVSLTNLGRNVTRNSNWGNSFQAYYGDEAEFSVQVKNNTSGSLTNVTVKEVLPSNLSLISGSTGVDGMNWGGDITGAGLNLGTLAPGQSKTIKFRATVIEQTSGTSGSVTLTNTAYASADNVAQLSDVASVIVGGGEVLGASTVATGANTFGLVLLGMISCLIAIVVYCRLRENKLSEYLGNENGNAFLKYLIGLYFKIKLRTKLASLRFKQVYF